jgi:ketosteroid isomerase-like protein
MTEELGALLTGYYEEWFAAITQEGIGPLETFLADEWRYTNYDGVVRGKQSYLDHVGGLVETVGFVGPFDVEVSRYGSLALVLGGYRVTDLPDDGVLELRFTGVWMERDGRWQCLLHHNSEVTG